MKYKGFPPWRGSAEAIAEERGISGGPETPGPEVLYIAFFSVRFQRRKGEDGWGPVKLIRKYCSD